ncbi:hypothetical protein BJX63DRAFT_303906 [Aspergillus granulosus]|uniref:Zn(2)-C6 fungal-type domain-containing protein n=1 Tax=Aspergillus granulosus TaxID=176169 RepID=A0ABR4H5K2_9EURO
MKRSAPHVAAPSDRVSFQQPVSCQFCRGRKLKCNRGRPCFKCSSRNHECVYESGLFTDQYKKLGRVLTSRSRPKPSTSTSSTTQR